MLGQLACMLASWPPCLLAPHPRAACHGAVPAVRISLCVLLLAEGSVRVCKVALCWTIRLASWHAKLVGFLSAARPLHSMMCVTRAGMVNTMMCVTRACIKILLHHQS